jgi:hypothetical protein
LPEKLSASTSVEVLRFRLAQLLTPEDASLCKRMALQVWEVVEVGQRASHLLGEFR